MLHQTCVFACGGICGSHSAFQCIQAAKHRCTIFMLGWARCGFHKKHVRTRYTKLVFLHMVGSMGHGVHSGASRARNIDSLFFILKWDWYGFHKKASGHVTLNLCFCTQSDLQVTLFILVRPKHKISTHYFSCLGGPGVVSIKSVLRHIMPNLCFFILWDLRVM
jgi:hypothetical protein